MNLCAWCLTAGHETDLLDYPIGDQTSAAGRCVVLCTYCINCLEAENWPVFYGRYCESRTITRTTAGR